MNILYEIAGWIMKLCYSASFNNYILTILIFSIVTQIILFPFSIKQQKSTVKRASLKPKEEEIMRKYRGRNDRETQQKMQMEIQEMYKAEGYSPTAGCLPLLIQFPVIIALFGVVRLPLTYTTNVDNAKVGELGYDMDDFYQHAYKVIDNQIEAYNTSIKALETEKIGKSEAEISAIEEKIDYCEERVAELNKTKKTENDGKISGGLQNKGETYRELKLIKFMQNGVDKFYKDVDDKVVSLEDNEVVALFDGNKTESSYESGSLIEKLAIKEDAVAKLEGEKVYDFNALLADKNIYTQKDIDKGVRNGAHCLPNFDFIGNTSILDQPSYLKFNWLLIVPVLVFLSSFWSGEVSRKHNGATSGADAQNPMNNGFMRWGMPLMSTFFAFSFPAAIGIYWTVKSVISVGQQYLLSKMFPLPKFTETEIREAVKEIKQAKKRKKIITIEVDEDDTSYDDIAISEERAEKIRRRRERLQKESEEAEANAKVSDKGIEKPALKDENRKD